MGLPQTIRRYGRGAARRARDRLAVQAYASLIHGPLEELVAEVEGLRADLARAEQARLDLEDRLSLGANRLEVLLDEVRAMREELERLARTTT